MEAQRSRYHEVYARWQHDPEGFWGEAAQEIDWIEPAKRVFDPDAGIYGRWFVGGVCNTCWNAVDRHVRQGRGEQPAIIYDSPLAGEKRTLTYHALQVETRVLAVILRSFGVEKGDRVLLYMPMVPEAAIAMLACARIGAVHSMVFGGFAANELATRIDDAKPKVILSASCGLEPGRIVKYKPLLDEAIRLSTHKPNACLILQRPQEEAAMVAGRDLDWAKARDQAIVSGRSVDCVPVAATDPLYILYTSGTTGRPKGVVRDNGGHLVALKWSMRNLYGVEPGEVYWAASDVGWVVGHSYIVYAPLFHGCTSILYEGKPVGTPDAGAFWRVIAEHQCVAMFTAPTAFRAIKKEDPQGKFLAQYDLKRFRTLFLAGERADPDTLAWAENSTEETGDRPLVADRDRMGDRRQSGGPRSIAGKARLIDGGDAWLRFARGRRHWQGTAGERHGIDRRQIAVAAGVLADAVAAGRLVQAELPRRVSRLLHDRGRRLQGRRLLHLRHEPYRRHYQRCGPPTLDRRNGGGAERPQGRRRMRGDRRLRRAQGRNSVRLYRAQGGRDQTRRRDRTGVHQPHSRKDRADRGLQACNHGRSSAEDSFGQGPARHHEEDR